MRRLAAALLWAALPVFAAAQTPVVAPAPGNISVDAVEVVRTKPDTVKIFLKVEAKNAEALAAADESADELKRATGDLGKLKVDGMTMTASPPRTVRVETDVRNNLPGGGGQRMQVDFRTTRPIVLTVYNTDPEKLAATVEKVQLEVSKLGIANDVNTSNYVYTPSGQERQSPFRAHYTRKAGWDELTGPALEKATKKARAKAEALAAGAGVKLGEVLSIQETTSMSNYPQQYNPGGVPTGITTEPEDEFADGELVRKIRVRVVFATK